VLVTHDRYMLDRVSTVVLGLNGMGQAQRFADYLQWEAWEGAREFADTSQSAGAVGAGVAAAANQRSASSAVAVESKAAPKNAKTKLSYTETRELTTIEERIAKAEEELEAACAAMENPATVADRTDFREICARFEQAQNIVDTLYTRWAELEQKKS
jgi:ATP-binding cassette subfamily F protein uup